MKLFNNRTLAEEEVDKIIKEVDHNMSGSVDFTGIFNALNLSYKLIILLEFITASMTKEKLLSKTRIEQAFKMFDLVRTNIFYFGLFFGLGWKWIYFEIRNRNYFGRNRNG